MMLPIWRILGVSSLLVFSNTHNYFISGTNEEVNKSQVCDQLLLSKTILSPEISCKIHRHLKPRTLAQSAFFSCLYFYEIK